MSVLVFVLWKISPSDTSGVKPVWDESYVEATINPQTTGILESCTIV